MMNLIEKIQAVNKMDNEDQRDRQYKFVRKEIKKLKNKGIRREYLDMLDFNYKHRE